MLRSLIYVSQSTLAAEAAAVAVEDIVRASRRHNLAMDVTGALVFTGAHFAQILEGGGDALRILMDTIARDDRHVYVRLLRNTEISERSFGEWSMAYSGPSSYLEDHIAPLLFSEAADRPAPDAIDRLVIAMEEFRDAAQLSV